MTEEFAEIVNRLARARNFEEGSFLLITSEPEMNKVIVEMKGKAAEIISGIGSTLERILESINDDDALVVRNFITTILLKDEQTRYQSKHKGGK